MNNTINPPIRIEKESIGNLYFPPEELLQSKEEIDKRLNIAIRAMKLGNLYNDKVKIVFEDSEGVKMVETTVWGLTDERMLLKGGIAIPICRIHEVIV